MHTVDLLYTAIPDDDREPLPTSSDHGICCVTGAECAATVPRRELLTKSFTDQALLRAPESDRVGVTAWTALTFKWERMSSWFCDGQQFVRLTRQDVRSMVLDGVATDRPWAGYITTSYKKHGSLRAPVNTGNRQVWLFESVLADCTDRGRLAYWWTVMTEAQRQGISRRSMETLDMPAGIALKLGAEQWEAYRRWARDKWRGPVYALLCYCLPSIEEMKGSAG